MTVSLQYAQRNEQTLRAQPRLLGATDPAPEGSISKWVVAGVAAVAGAVAGAVALGMRKREPKRGVGDLGRVSSRSGSGRASSRRKSSRAPLWGRSDMPSGWASYALQHGVKLKQYNTEISYYLNAKGERKMPKDKGDCLRIGRNHPYHKFGTYEVCLTPTQKEHLQLGKKLGCGVFGCAYEQKGTGRAVKITRDAADVASLILAQKSGVVPELYEARTLGKEGDSVGTALFDGKKTKVFALTVEKLRTFSDTARDEEQLDEKIIEAVSGVLREGGSSPWQQPDDVAIYCRDPENTGASWAASPEACDAAKAALKLRDSTNIVWSDSHAGNVGYDKNGRMKILDLGLTTTQLEKDPPALEGMNRALARRLAGL